MTKNRPYQLRLWWPAADGSQYLGANVRTFAKQEDAEQAAEDARIFCRRNSDLPEFQPTGYQIVNRNSGTVQADVRYPTRLVDTGQSPTATTQPVAP